MEIQRDSLSDKSEGVTTCRDGLTSTGTPPMNRVYNTFSIFFERSSFLFLPERAQRNIGADAGKKVCACVCVSVRLN